MEKSQIIEGLREFGLSMNEAKSYLALAKLGNATTGQIAKEARIHNSKSYEALNSLLGKGFTSYQIKGKIKVFYALEPAVLGEKLLEREKKIKNSISELKKIYTSSPVKQGIYAYEKVEGVKSIFKHLLSVMHADSECLILAGRSLNLKMEGFLIDFHRKRVKKGVKAKIIHCLPNLEYGMLREQLGLTKVRYVEEYIPASINIYGEYVGIMASADEPVGVLIRSKEISDSFREYFRIVWKNALSPNKVK